MADWLALHGLTVGACRAVLGHTTSAPSHRAPDPAYPAAMILSDVLDALGAALPALGDVLARVRTEMRIDLAPDMARFPRAFTLHDDGSGLPFISCPVKGHLSDLLFLAHEVGHACQILASGTSDLPPALREMAAYLAEEMVCLSITRRNPDFGKALVAIHRARTSRIMQRDGTALLQALDHPDAVYDYGWNYPIARELAGRTMTGDLCWQVFSGQVGLGALAAMPYP